MQKLLTMFRIPDIRNSILFVVLMLVIFRLVAHIPVPGVDASALAGLVEGNQFFGLLNIFSGGTLDSFSVMALGVAPYITSSIIFQLFPMIMPKFEELQKEEAGRRKLNQWTRLATVPLAAIQAYGLTVLLSQQAGAPIAGLAGWDRVLTIFAMVVGTVLLMWIGELISEKGIGNGISLLILAGIIAGLPTFLGQQILTFDQGSIITLVLFIAMVLVTIYAIVVMNEAQRNIPVQHARQIRGARLLGGQANHMPLRLNPGGVIPIIFAISIILLPTTLAQFFLEARTGWIREMATWTLQIINDQVIYGVLYFLLVFGFTYFYAKVVFKPEQVAENLQKSAAFVPGIRPGPPTAQYLNWVMNRLLFAGALFLSLIAVLPLVVQQFTGSANLVIGGTSILIVVAVIIDMLKQIDARITMHSYEY
ncbi:MAG: Protein translocase subunit SecY [Parcubacteria group bacterium GW2011_GWA2_56_7]|nr:MAG: Protein translocase subunit SecY [Parcubacteria group bacterium GW2011_GWA2_56_7]